MPYLLSSFLWTLYCNDSNTHINKQEFVKALQIESTYEISGLTFPSSSQNQTPTSTPIPQPKVNHQLQQQQNVINSNLLLSLFGSSDRVTFEQFRSWITIHKGATVLSRWLLLESCVNLSSELETPTFYQSLAGVTHLEEQDIGDLEKVFWLLKGLAITGQLDLESLGPLISPPVPKSALSGVFLAFDENRDGHIDFKELCCGVSAACRGPSVERSKFCFKVFDTDRDGVLNHHEIQQMVSVLLFVAQESSNSNQFKSLTFDNVMLELYKRSVNENVNGNVKSEEEGVVKDNKVIMAEKGE
jgi:ubiquitin carboxyl-terminal hydrolase 6/32